MFLIAILNASMIILASLFTASSTLAFVVVTPPVTQPPNVAHPLLTIRRHSKSFTSRKGAFSHLFSQQSSSASIESTNQTNSDSLMLHHHSPMDDYVATMTSKALEEEDDPLFLSSLPQQSLDAHQMMKNTKVSNPVDRTPMYQPEHHSVISPVSQPEPPMIHKNTLEPHVFHFNKILIDTVYNVICTLYPSPKSDATTQNPVNEISQKCFARFYVLETVARVPYFAYLSVLHLRETLGERQYSSSSGSSPTLGSDTAAGRENINNGRLRTHYAEADNELHHLLIMESLGGHANPVDRAIAQCMAVGYYWYVVFVYTMISPQAAYHLSELIEDHAYHTYDDFLHTYESELKQLPVPPIATQYYMNENTFLQDLCRTVADTASRTLDTAPPMSRPKPILNSLYDVFVCIRDDEKEHWKTLCHLVQYDQMSAVSSGEEETIPVQSTQPSNHTIMMPWSLL